MKKFKLIGVSEIAEKHLNREDLESLKEMIGSEICESERDSAIEVHRLFTMPDGEDCHEDFLIVEEIKNSTNEPN